jgi:hypothetical protein
VSFSLVITNQQIPLSASDPSNSFFASFVVSAGQTIKKYTVCPRIGETTLVKEKNLDLNFLFLWFSPAWLKTNF